jgi:hypothetical protein
MQSTVILGYAMKTRARLSGQRGESGDKSDIRRSKNTAARQGFSALLELAGPLKGRPEPKPGEARAEIINPGT